MAAPLALVLADRSAGRHSQREPDHHEQRAGDEQHDADHPHRVDVLGRLQPEVLDQPLEGGERLGAELGLAGHDRKDGPADQVEEAEEGEADDERDGDKEAGGALVEAAVGVGVAAGIAAPSAAEVGLVHGASSIWNRK